MADTGCHLHPHCLSCPLAVCIYDEEPSQSSWDRRHPDAAIRRNAVNAMHKAGSDVRAIASTLKITVRSVYRLLAQP